MSRIEQWLFVCVVALGTSAACATTNRQAPATAAAKEPVRSVGDQRGLELLVTAGFTPEQAIAIATSNGARFVHDRTVGSIAEGMQADLVVVRGNPSRHISDVRNVELVFKDGVAYDPEALVAAAAGTLGEFTLERLFTWPFALGLALVVLLVEGNLS